MSPHQNINLDTTLGAVFIGNVVAATLFGVTTLQTFIFFRGNTRDRKFFKRLIAFLWLLDLLHMMFMTHGVYHYLISNFGNFSAFVSPTWSLLVINMLFMSIALADVSIMLLQDQVIITCLSDFIVRGVFARRIWLLSGHNNVLLFVNVVTSIFVFAMGITFAARGFIDMSYTKLTMESWILYTALGGSVIADGLITASLCVLLDHSRTGFKSTDSLVNTLMLYSINTGLLTSVCATACFVTFAIWPHQFVFMGIYFVLGKLYLNSLLAVLNTREALRKRNSGMTSIPHSPSSIEPLNMNLMSTANLTAESEPPSPAMPKALKVAWHLRA